MPRRSNYLRPVKSDKHEVNWTFLGDASANKNVTIVQGVQPAIKDAPTEVGIGSKVGFIYFEFQFSADSVVNAKVVHWKIIKAPFGTAATNSNTYYQNDRRFILKRGMEMLPKNQNTIIKRIVGLRIPPRLSRIGDNDIIQFKYSLSTAEAINACGIAIYKELM